MRLSRFAAGVLATMVAAACSPGTPGAPAGKPGSATRVGVDGPIEGEEVRPDDSQAHYARTAKVVAEVPVRAVMQGAAMMPNGHLLFLAEAGSNFYFSDTRSPEYSHIRRLGESDLPLDVVGTGTTFFLLTQSEHPFGMYTVGYPSGKTKNPLTFPAGDQQSNISLHAATVDADGRPVVIIGSWPNKGPDGTLKRVDADGTVRVMPGPRVGAHAMVRTGDGNLWIAPTATDEVRRYPAAEQGWAETAATVWGAGGKGWVDGPLERARFQDVRALATAGDDILVADQQGTALRVIQPDYAVVSVRLQEVPGHEGNLRTVRIIPMPDGKGFWLQQSAVQESGRLLKCEWQ